MELQQLLSQRKIRNIIQIVQDLIASNIVTVVVAKIIGLPLDTASLLVMSLLISILRITGNYFFGSYRHLWRYTSLREIQNLGLNTILITALISAAHYVELLSLTPAFILVENIGYFVAAASIRVLRRVQVGLKSLQHVASDPSIKKRTLLIGAGNTANILLQDLKNTKAPLQVIGILDDDPAKQNAELHGIKILGPTTKLEAKIKELQIQQVVITMPSAQKEVLDDLVGRCRKEGVSVKISSNVFGILNTDQTRHNIPIRLRDLTNAKEMQEEYLEKLNENKKNHVLITGGAGYIGNHLAKRFLDDGYRVRILDNFTYGREGLRAIENHPNLEIIEGDIANIRDVVRSIKDVEIVIALAAIVGDPACGLNAEETLNLNYESTKILVEAANFYGVRRLVFASSCSVYGASDDSLLTEESLLNPVSLYARTRIMSEEVILERCGDVEPVILRLSTVFGHSDRMRFDLVVNTLTVRGIVNKAFQVFGGNQWRPFVHCQDVAKAFYLAATASSDAVSPIIFNVGTSEFNYTINDIAKMIQEELPEANVEYKDDIDDPRNYRVNFERIKTKLGFKADFTIQDGVKEMIQQINDNKALQEFNNEKYSNLNSLKSIFSDQVPQEQ